MIVERLRQTRERLDIKQKDLTELYGVTYSSISGWETGKETIPLRQLIKYANKYNFSLDYLFGLTDHNEKYEPLVVDIKVMAVNLRAKRKENNKTQKQVAEIINTSQSAYAHYENGRYLIPTNFLYNLSKIFKNFSIDEILGRKKI